MQKENKLFYLGVLPAFFMPLIFVFLFYVIFPGSFAGKVFYIIKCVFLAVWPFVFLRLFGVKNAGRKLVKRSVIYGFLSGALITAIAGALYLFFYGYFEAYRGNVIGKLQGYDLNHPVLFILLGAYIFIVNSFLEEYYWRYFILNGLKLKFNPFIAVILSSVSFTLHHIVIINAYFPLHLNIILSVIVFGAGLMWSFISHKTGTLTGSWISHIIADIVIVAVGYLMMFG